MKPHKHAEVIHAFADGAKLQVRLCGAEHWQETRFPDFADECEYRIKPEPAAPKWPQTTMTSEQMLIAQAGLLGMAEQNRALANAAIAHACEAGQVIPQGKTLQYCDDSFAQGAKKSAISAIEATFEHMRLGRLDSETIQIILLKAAK